MMNLQKVIKGKFCSICGTSERYEHTKECVGCHHYRTQVKALNINGIDGRKEKKQLEGQLHYDKD